MSRPSRTDDTTELNSIQFESQINHRKNTGKQIPGILLHAALTREFPRQTRRTAAASEVNILRNPLSYFRLIIRLLNRAQSPYQENGGFSPAATCVTNDGDIRECLDRWNPSSKRYHRVICICQLQRTIVVHDVHRLAVSILFPLFDVMMHCSATY